MTEEREPEVVVNGAKMAFSCAYPVSLTGAHRLRGRIFTRIIKYLEDTGTQPDTVSVRIPVRVYVGLLQFNDDILTDHALTHLDGFRLILDSTVSLEAICIVQSSPTP